MSNADRQSPEAIPTGDPAAKVRGHESDGISKTEFPESARDLLLTFLFDLAAQHVRRYRRLDPENLSHEIGLRAFEHMSRQPAAREKICLSFQAGTDEWKRVAHICVIHARAELVRRELRDKRRESGMRVEDLESPAPGGAETNALRAELWRCVALLDDDRRSVIRLRFERGLTFQEIADELNWNKTRVYGCYATALIQLERSLKSSV